MKRINELIKSIQRDGPLAGIGKPEVLKGNFKGCYSRRIDDEHRLIYNVSSEKEINKTLITACRTHYSSEGSKQKKELMKEFHI